MSLFSDNLKYLRDTKNWSQQDVADKLLIKLARYSTYEYGRTEPPYDILVQLSALYMVTIDLLLTVDLRKVKFDDLVRSGKNRFLMPVMVDQNGENLIEVVSEKAKAGYLPGSVDQQYVDELQTMSFPGLRNRKFRTFPIGGDSMSFSDKSFITGALIEKFSDIKDGKTYIIVTHNEGMAYKRLYKKDKLAVLAESDNPAYEPYEIKADEIWEIWEFVYAHDPNDSKRNIFGDYTTAGLLMEISKDIKVVKEKIGA